ncbi:MAG TPA: PHP domain-containing protein [Archaeoglobus profundus]|nr:PHP domain-containing protein [Archaeoglobus profundus]
MLTGDLHIHSNHSDGKDSVKKILYVAIKKRLDVISITDHDTLNGSLEAMEILADEHLPIKVIPGMELSTAQGHLLVYGLRREIEPGIDLIEAVKIVHELNGVTSLAHPFQFYRHGAIKLRLFKIVDCIEVFNGRSLPFFNKLAEYFCDKFGKSKTAGSDAHRAESIQGVILIEDDKDILQAIKSGKTRVKKKI